MPSTDTYVVEIEYLAKELVEVEALSETWAKIIAKEKWEVERSENIEAINIKGVKK